MALWHMYTHTHTHTHTHRQGERDRQTDRQRDRETDRHTHTTECWRRQTGGHIKSTTAFLINFFPWQVHISTTGLIVTPPPSSPVTTGPSFTFPTDVPYQAALGVSIISVSLFLSEVFSLDDLPHSSQLPRWMLRLLFCRWSLLISQKRLYLARGLQNL